MQRAAHVDVVIFKPDPEGNEGFFGAEYAENDVTHGRCYGIQVRLRSVEA
jgi:hypothetical protein